MESTGRLSMRRLRLSLDAAFARVATLGDNAMLDALREWKTSYNALHETQTLTVPDGFLAAAWRCFKETLQNPHYYLSMHELLMFARLANINLVVSTYDNATFHFAGATFSYENSAEIVYVCLDNNNTGRVRGHFERMWTCVDWNDTRDAWAVELEQR